jgi:hypothetical protein
VVLLANFSAWYVLADFFTVQESAQSINYVVMPIGGFSTDLKISSMLEVSAE